MDFDTSSTELDWYTDSSANPKFGTGGYAGNSWFILQWDETFIEKASPSINYLELYGVTIAVFLWIQNFKNKHVTIFCDNMSVVQMVNNTSSKCKNYMILIRMIILKMLEHNTKITLKHVFGEQNKFADHLSRMRYRENSERNSITPQKTFQRNYGQWTNIFVLAAKRTKHNKEDILSSSHSSRWSANYFNQIVDKLKNDNI